MCVTTNPGTPETPEFLKLVEEFKDWIPEITKNVDSDEEEEEEDHEDLEIDNEEEDSKRPLRGSKRRRNGGRLRKNGISKEKSRDWLRRGPFEWSRCKNTGEPKPPRSHYCHVRKAIVLNMDHYCPWMFNTVGFLNYRYFVSFLIWLWIGCFFVAFEAGSQVFHHKTQGSTRKTAIQRNEEHSIMFLFVLCLSVGVAVSILMFWHIYLVLTAQTTIEFYGNFTRKSKWRGEGSWKNPYDEGSYKKNWQRVFGHGRWIFYGLLPSSRPPDGYPWGIRKGKKEITRNMNEGMMLRVV